MRLVVAALRPVGPDARVFVMLLDGASLEYISPAAAEGRLAELRPHARLGSGHASLDHPADAAGAGLGRRGDGQVPAEERRPVGGHVWRSVPAAARSSCCPTTALPMRCVHLGLLTRDAERVDRSCRRVRCGAFSAACGVTVGIVGWPLTYPAQPVSGFVISDRFQIAEGAFLEVSVGDARSGSPKTSCGPRARRPTRSRSAALPVAAAGAASEGLTSQAAANAPATRDRVVQRGGGYAGALARAAVPGGAVSGARRVGHRYLRYAHAALVWRRRRSASVAATAASSSAITRSSTSEVGRDDGGARAWTICCSSSPDSAWSRSALASACWRGSLGDPTDRHARSGARTGSCSPTAARSRPAELPRWLDRRRRADGALLPGLPSAATWTASRAPISSRRDFTTARPITFIPSYER